MTASWPAHARIHELAKDPSTSTHPNSSRRSFERAAAAGPEAHGYVARRPRPRRCSRTGATHELPRLILEWRELMKLKGTAPTRCRSSSTPDRTRAHLLQPGGRRYWTTEQQRSESAEHSDQDRARPRDPARLHRGRAMPISADYSQIELRVWRTAGDETLIEAFRRGTMTTIRRR